jgi:hypothetical protein
VNKEMKCGGEPSLLLGNNGLGLLKAFPVPLAQGFKKVPGFPVREFKLL